MWYDRAATFSKAHISIRYKIYIIIPTYNDTMNTHEFQ